MELGKAKELISTIQSVLVSLAIISGGVWALITLTPYWEAMSLTEKLKSSIAITMSVKQVRLPDNTTDKKTLLIEVTTKNTGGHSVTYNFASNELQISQQIPEYDSNTYLVGKTYYGKFMGEAKQPTYASLAPGGQITYEYGGLVNEPGLYSVVFKALPEGAKDEDKFYFAARRLIVIQ